MELDYGREWYEEEAEVEGCRLNRRIDRLVRHRLILRSVVQVLEVNGVWDLEGLLRQVYAEMGEELDHLRTRINSID